MSRMTTIGLIAACCGWLFGCSAVVTWDTDRLPRDSGTDTPDVEDSVDTADVQGDPDAMEDPIEDLLDEDGAVVCPPNTGTQLFVRASGIVRDIQTDMPQAGLFVAAVAPQEAMTNPVSPPLLASTITESDGSFDLGCINVKDVNIGLILLVDDNPRDSVLGSYIPTGVLAKIWLSDTDKVDVTDADVYALSSVLNSVIVAMTGINTNTVGLVMGHVLDGNTGARLNGAIVERTIALDVEYPDADWSGSSGGGGTSASGAFILAESVTMASITASLTGYTFKSYIASTMPAFCFYLPIEGIHD